MKSNTLKKTITIFALAFVFILGAGGFAGAQTDRRAQRKQERIEKQQRKVWERQAKLEDRSIRLSQQREQVRLRNMRNRAANVANDRYRINRHGAYSRTDERGVELLKQAVNTGYQQGYRAGRNYCNRRRSSSYNNSTVYRRETMATRVMLMRDNTNTTSSKASNAVTATDLTVAMKTEETRTAQ
ncbi:MAG TPA: hypothetical protein VIL74_02275 [Pyrinomonadaceae bacterium]|jgi:hypothetical protein